jgi:hypothetical protein
MLRGLPALLRGSGAPVGDTALAGDGAVGRPEGDGHPGDRADQVQAVVGAVDGQEVDVAVAGREQAVDEGQAVAGGQQPPIGPGGVQPAPERQPGQADGQVDQVVEGVDLEAEQGLVGLGGEVLDAGDEEAEDADEGVDGADGQGQQLAGCLVEGAAESGRRAMKDASVAERAGAGPFHSSPACCRAVAG